MKKPAAVIAAEEVVARKAEAVEAAKTALAFLQDQYAQAVHDVRAAQEESDKLLPHCLMAAVSWHSGKATGVKRVVIERKTPGGILIVRGVGDPCDQERRFKLQKLGNKFVEEKRQHSMMSDRRELRDVPAEYLPATKGLA